MLHFWPVRFLPSNWADLIMNPCSDLKVSRGEKKIAAAAVAE